MNLDRATARAISRIGKELVGALEASKNKDKNVATSIFGKHGGLANYSSDYIIGLAVALGIIWESVNEKPLGSAHSLSVVEILNWVRDVQKLDNKEIN